MSSIASPSAADVESAVVTTAAGVSVEVYDQGAGAAVVLLPSLGRGAADFDVVARLLAADGFRVLRPEPRGVGASTGPIQGLTMHDLAQDVALALDHLGISDAIVVGHAFGSQPARMLAELRPDLVRALVLAAASAGKVPVGSKEQPYKRLRQEIDRSGDRRFSEEERIRCLTAAFFAPGHDPRVWLDGWSQPAHEAQAHAREATPVDAYFEAGGKPILDLQAEFDAVVIPNIYRPMLGERVTVQTIENAGHALLPEQPEAFARAVADYARALPSQDTRR
ncbi:alpha/beta fold hydrolase [Pseudoclavibacter sp. 8L]|uniref:alpha/beta fold hydrolase n=1 Tax=Pseudoclavibacter sp. 8L TaxID=2653162 RepID=UPI0012F302A8|nr:alpha/beta hydrolase [Pseudoclavibacter sp. 8L]VXC06721.1 Hydrolase [Pseudoclavibacter sp. 8L]